MAIDSADKRKSVMNFFTRILPTSDNVINVADRAHVGGIYRGLAVLTQSGQFSVDLLIKKLFTKSISSDILIKKLFTKSISSDILILQNL
jgi:hypothetical protein